MKGMRGMLSNQINNTQVTTNIDSLQPRKLVLTKGQIFQGQVLKLFPNNLAALQIGNMNVSARLEAPLTAGATYWFEVTQTSGIPRLRVLDDNMVRNSQPTQTVNGERQLTPDQLLQQMGLSSNKTNVTLLTRFIADKIPFSKDMIEQGGALLQQVGQMNEKGIQTLYTLIQKGLPLTKETFLAIQSAEQAKTSLFTDIYNLLNQLQNGVKQTATFQSFIKGIETILQETKINGGTDSIVQLFKYMTSNQGENIRQGSMSILQQLGVIPKGLTESQFYDFFKAQLLDPNNSQIVKTLWPFLNNNGVAGIPLHKIDSKTLYELFISKLDIPEGAEGQAKLNLFLSLFQKDLNSQSMKQELAHFMNHKQLTLQERTVLEQLVQSSINNETLPNEQKSPIAAQLSRIISSLGMMQEKELLEFFQGNSQELDGANGERLKSLLLQLNQMKLPYSLKNSVETLIHRLTGQQLLANEQIGSLHQVAVQIPLQLGNFPTELTVQWEGKKKSNGEIDSDHCRILFYLQLERLNETIVDVQIQKRFVSIHIFNEQDRPNFLIDALYPVLKEKLQQFDYQLTSINWKKVGEATKVTAKKEHVPIHNYQPQRTYQGVDYRV